MFLESLKHCLRNDRRLFAKFPGRFLYVMSDQKRDIPLLVGYYVEKTAGELGKKPPIIPQAVLQALQEHLFVGNVRELINMVRQAVTLTINKRLSIEDFPDLSE